MTAVRPPMPAALSPGTFVELQGYVSMEAAHYTRKVNAGAVGWTEIPNYGRTLSSMTVSPVTAPSATPAKNSPCLEYRMSLSDAGPVNVTAILAPSLNFVAGRGLRYAVSLDDAPPQVVDIYAQETHSAWQKSVIDNCRIVTTPLTVDRPGVHTLKFWMVDPGVVLQKLVVDLGGVKPSDLGPPESVRLNARTRAEKVERR